MFIRQISAFVENRSGAAAEALGILASHNINLRALSIADTTDYGILRMIVDLPDEAIRLLSENHIIVRDTPVLAVPLGDRPGGLVQVLNIFRDGDVSVDYMYAFASRTAGQAVVVVKVDNAPKAGALLREQGIEPLSASTLG